MADVNREDDQASALELGLSRRGTTESFAVADGEFSSLKFQVFDIAYDGSRSESLLSYISEDATVTESQDMLGTLPQHLPNTARVLDVFNSTESLSTALNDHILQKYPESAGQKLIHERSGTTSFFDIWSLGRQWSGISECVYIHTTTTITEWSDFLEKRHITGLPTYMSCFGCNGNRLLVIRNSRNTRAKRTIEVTWPASHRDNMFTSHLLENKPAAMAHQSRVRLAKLFVLDLLASSAYLADPSKLIRVEDDYLEENFWAESQVFLGADRSLGSIYKSVDARYSEFRLTTSADRFAVLLRLYESTRENLVQLAENIDFVIASLTQDRLTGPEALHTVPDVASLDACIWNVQKLCHQRRDTATRTLDALMRRFDAHLKTADAQLTVANLRESKAVKKLSVLATVFLSLSLSASILSMNIRLKDLHLLLFDSWACLWC